MSMRNLIKITLGDWSNDGHGMTTDYLVDFSPNVTPQKIMDAYKFSTLAMGFNFVQEVCHEYEENVIKEEHYKILLMMGYDGSSDFDASHDVVIDNDYYIDTDTYFNMYMFIIEMGFVAHLRETFVYKITNDEVPNINIGGYGLFN